MAISKRLFFLYKSLEILRIEIAKLSCENITEYKVSERS